MAQFSASRHIAVVIGTRPEIVKLAQVVRMLGDAARVLHTRQHQDEELSGFFLAAAGVRQARTLSGICGASRHQQVGRMIEQLGAMFSADPPAAVIVQGDTNTASAAAQAASYASLPLIHVEAGLRSFDRGMPEEINRCVIGVLADLHCAPTARAVANLRAEGIQAAKIALTGNTIVEATLSMLPDETAARGIAAELGADPGGYVLATIHRPENTDDPDRLETILVELSKLGLPVLLPLHPRTRLAVAGHGLTAALDRLRPIAPVDHRTFLGLARLARLLVSDSGGVQEECTVLKRPLIVVRNSTERPESVESGFAHLVRPGPMIGDLGRELIADPLVDRRLARIRSPFGDGRASERIAGWARTFLAPCLEPADGWADRAEPMPDHTEPMPDHTEPLPDHTELTRWPAPQSSTRLLSVITRSRWHRARRILLVSGLSLLGLTSAAVAAIFIAGNQLTGNVARIPNVFKGLSAAGRPGVPAAYRQGMTILVVGSDSRSAVPIGKPQVAGSQQQSDAIMLVHINANGRAASVISIPRNSWVRVPGLGMMSFFKVLALGGPPLMIKTVEQLTGVRIDHYAVVDFAGFRSVIQALGGVHVEVAQATRRAGVAFHQGLNELNPRAAMVYVSTAARPAGCRCWQRNGLPGGDLSRVQRQQNLIRAILATVASRRLLSDPITWYRLLDAFSRTVSVDSTFTNAQLRSLVLRLAQLHGGDLVFLTVPVRGLGWRSRDGVVYLNMTQCATLWSAVRHDSVAVWAARHPATLTPEVPY